MINKKYNSYIKVAEIFANTTIFQLTSIITQKIRNFKTIIKLNSVTDLPNIFMIHPGASGCEVYTSLANSLSSYYSCYGVDSYNLHAKDKIISLSKLASYYLAQIDNVMQETNQTDYILLGWSLGGQIAVEIALQLEDKGFNKVKLYLLDTIIPDAYITKLRRAFKDDWIEKDIRKRSQKYEADYVEKLVANIKIEKLICEEHPYKRLDSTKVILFKAMELDHSLDIQLYRDFLAYNVSLTDNNISKVCATKELITQINLNCTHMNILNHEHEIIEILIAHQL
jgi:pimeloyl-ACP methyl ester carboxylesterase